MAFYDISKTRQLTPKQFRPIKNLDFGLNCRFKDKIVEKLKREWTFSKRSKGEQKNVTFKGRKLMKKT